MFKVCSQAEMAFLLDGLASAVAKSLIVCMEGPASVPNSATTVSF